MQVSVEAAEGLKRRMTVQVPAERVDEDVNNRLRKLRGQVRLDGFRPGKVPLKLVQQRYGDRVRGEALGEIVQQTYGEALDQEGLRPAGQPEIEPLETDAGKNLEYVASFEVLPQVELTGLESIEVERPAVDITEADIDYMLERLRKQHAEFHESEGAAAEGDRVTFDFHGTVDGEEFEGNAGDDVVTVIGSGQMPPEFERELAGCSGGEDKAIEYVFPEQFPDEHIAGRGARFAVKVKRVEAARLPALDDAFAERVGIAEGLDTLRTRMRESLERERDQAVRAQIKRVAMQQLADKNDIELPQVLVDGEIAQLREQTKQRMQQQGETGDIGDLPASQFEDEARRRVKLGLLVNEVVRANSLEVEQSRVQDKLREVASGHENPQQVAQYYMQNREMMQSLEVQVMEDQVAELLAERGKVVDKPMSLQELIG